MLEKKADVNTKNKDEQTPLWQATWNGHKAVVKVLLEKGADVDVKDKDGETPLRQAAVNGHETVVETLLEKGAAWFSAVQFSVVYVMCSD